MTSNDVRDVLDLGSGPRPAKKAKAIAAPKSTLKGLMREVQNLGGDNPIAIVPEMPVFKKRRLTARKPAVKWDRKPFRNSARNDDLVLKHWRKKPEIAASVAATAGEGEDGATGSGSPIFEEMIEDSTFAKFNVRVNTPKYDDERYEAYLKNEDWSKDETDYLMEIVQDYDLRWPVIWDRYAYEPVASADNTEDALIPVPKTRSLEELKDRYYKISADTMKARKPLETMNQADFDLYEKMNHFNSKQETYRKQYAESAFNRTKDEAKEEESLLLELKRILARSDKMSEERKELYARLEAPPSQGNISVYTSSQGLQSLFQQLATVSKARNPRRSIMGPDGISPATAGLQQSFDRRDSTARESISGPSGMNGKKGPGYGPPEHRQLTAEEERSYGVAHMTDRSTSGPIFRWERLNKPITSKSANLQSKIGNTLTELGIPSRLHMPTADVGTAWMELLDGVMKVLDMKKAVEKAAGELSMAQNYKDERERKDRAARGDPEPEPEPQPDHEGDADDDGENGANVKDKEGDMKMENAGREISVPPRSTRDGSVAAAAVHKRSASVLSSVSEQSTKRQKK